MPESPLSVAAARDIVLAAVTPLATEEVPVADALGRVLAEEVRAAHDVPPFHSSAMDGYAVASGASGRRLRVVGESRAGTPATMAVGDGEAVRISTGAALPVGADAVLQQELVERQDATVTLLDDVAVGRNVRRPGEDLSAGEVVLGSGRRLGPAELGVAVNAGRGVLLCSRRPRVAVLVTGDELRPAGSTLGPGQIHDSNLVTLAALAGREGADVVLSRHVADDAQATRRELGEALERADVVLVSGGVSVGPHDHVKGALSDLGVAQRFWRVALRPGKPTWFGTRSEALVFGLPGNPVSAMVTFMLFARPALGALQRAEPDLSATTIIGEPLRRHPARDECVRVRIEGGVALSTGPQGSHVLKSMALADGLAVVPRGDGVLPAGEEVEFIRLQG